MAHIWYVQPSVSITQLYYCYQTCNSVPDTGTLSVAINGFTSSASYGSSSTDAALASTLATGFNASGSPVTATNTSGSSTFAVTAKTTGSSSNYPISISNGDFTISDPYNTLTGGHNAGTVYDAGTITATIITGGSPSSYTTSPVSWGQGDTPSTIATHLASAINTAASTVVTATTNGATINLVSATTGANTNYTVSVIVNDTQNANYPTLFPGASFSASSTNMSGGANATSTYGTIYSYQVPQGGYAPNGNILEHTDSVMGTWNFSYDAVDRLVTAQNTATGIATQYANVYGCWQYDSYGNRTSESMSTTACGSSPPLASWAGYNYTTANNNRIQTSSWATAGVSYDASGNTLNDGRNHYWYDGEGQLCAVQTIGGGIVQYIYDAEGARIAEGNLSSAPGSATAVCAPPAASGSTLTDTSIARIRDKGSDAVGDHLASFFKANSGAASDHHHQGIRVKRGCLVRGTEVVLNILPSLRLSGCGKHATPAHAGDVQPGVLHQAHARGQTCFLNLVSPKRD